MQQTPPRGSGTPGLHRAPGLLRELMLATQDVQKRLGSRLQVNPTDLEVLQLLILQGPLSPTVLARSLGISTAAATVATDRLVRDGHVSREPHPTDRRSLLVVPQEDSVRQALDYLRPLVEGTDALLAQYSSAEQVAITDYLERAIQLTRDVPQPIGPVAGPEAGKGQAP
ncbi:MAG: MarR family transcriptional regulator [Micrococcaceae bacterium]|jgi:DNA-binding MarR family transcriptional regulator|nr:MarR family transcriptional regulator [Micrococcaceae bacterium]